ncbi:MAG TPA: DUF2007 domain-containing protein [Terriglobales bacterium]|nr:DUF2007 domain-containing protein [Terriglobales bacterium]
MQFCPKCGYEYKTNIEVCPDCGRKLIAKLKQKKRKKIRNLDISEEEALSQLKLKLLYVTRSKIYAGFLKETLESNKIPCLIKSEAGYSLRVGALIRLPISDIKLYVREEDFEKSCEIKEQVVDSL